MTVTEGISDEAFRALVEHAGLNPTPEDLASLRALYEHFYEGLKSMHLAELGGPPSASSGPDAPTRSA